MNTSEKALTMSPARPLFERVVLDLLSQMKLGSLAMTLPSGEIICFGDGGPDSSHPIRADMQIHRPDFFKRVVLYSDVGFGEAYTDGLYDSSDLTQLLQFMIVNVENNPTMSGSRRGAAFLGVLRILNSIQHRIRDNTIAGSRRNIAAHYDLSNELFSAFLDPSMTYSCADFSTGAQTLEEAQAAKYDRLAQSLQLKSTDHLLEIGGGWGGFAVFVAKKYGCRVTTLTVSEQQLKGTLERIGAAGLQDRIEAKLCDYRDVNGTFDKIASIEMLEAVGHRHLPSFFETCERVLKKDGLLGVQVITCADSRYELLRRGVDWTQKVIFPGSLLPSIGALNAAALKTSRFHLFKLETMGPQYAKTLKIWRENFDRNIEEIKSLGFDAYFVRTWHYYFSYCEAAFLQRNISVCQAVYTRPNNRLLE